MICDKCKEKEAVVSIVEIVAGKEKTVNLCKDCAADSANAGIGVMHVPGGSFIGQLLSSLLGFSMEDLEEINEDDNDGEDKDSLKKNNIVCPSCNMTYEEFIKVGTFGCPDCYKTFNFLLDGYLKKIQGNSNHTGKHPVYSEETTKIPYYIPAADKTEESSEADRQIAITVDKDSSVEELKAALKRAVAREEFEEAARIRDMIRACQGDITNG